MDPSLLSKQSINLVLEGVDTVSTVYINGREVGTTDNQFVRYKFDLKKGGQLLKRGANSIRVEFESAPLYAKQKSIEYTNKYHYTVVPGQLSTIYNLSCLNYG